MENLLAQRDLKLVAEGRRFNVKAVAVFVEAGRTFGRNCQDQLGRFHIYFTSQTQGAMLWEPDRTEYSREWAKRAAEFTIATEYVELFLQNNIEDWLALGLW
jgi:hypothetical protein